jgi:uracil-DNA glycosylase family 4
VDSQWDSLNKEILECQKCPLSKSRKQAVPGEGPQDADIVIIGEGPGHHEDLQGRPFVGAAGQLLTQLLEGAGIKRESVFITNVVKCRPPENRQPLTSERTTCLPFLKRQLELIKPKIICLAGRVPTEVLLGKPVKMGAMHGKIFEKEEQTYFVMYHPAAGLYTQSLVSVMEEDMQHLKSILDEKRGRPSQKNGQLDLSSFFTGSEKI